MQIAEGPSEPVVDSLTMPAASSTSIRVAIGQSMAIQAPPGEQVAHPVPALDGFGLFVTAILLAAAALWIWRRQ